MERYFYAPCKLFPYKEKILLKRQKDQIISLQGKILLQHQKDQMERYFYALRTLFPYKEKNLLQLQKEQNGKVFSY